jgi:methionyl-tRNA formyltransferase
MRLVFMGSPEFSVPVLEALVNAGHEIAAVYCQPPRPAGRGKKDRPGPVHSRALELGLEVRHPVTLKGADAQKSFADLNSDAAVVVAYGLLLPQEILDAPTYGCLNIHASLLPRWRGAAPIHRAIMAGDKETGICIMQMEAGLDTGPVVSCMKTPIKEDEITAGLHDRLSLMGSKMIVQALTDIHTLSPEPQPDDGVTYAKKIDKSEAQIDWTKPAVEVDRLIRGLSPFPGAKCNMDGESVKLLASRVVQKSGTAGEVLEGLIIACGENAIEVLRAQRPGKRAMEVDDFLRGFDLPVVVH